MPFYAADLVAQERERIGCSPGHGVSPLKNKNIKRTKGRRESRMNRPGVKSEAVLMPGEGSVIREHGV
ncbi:hypothetical protein AOE01nite_33670 [Acetobacter oeni]|uniref:Uncharacterized protein n=1 Tax=Acetobacter oeni TaxID=304077 RepID=A0A511XQA2_9PROT|nr:hypothetical protein AOE01nite_33670 [Acetobacter oeni]